VDVAERSRRIRPRQRSDQQARAWYGAGDARASGDILSLGTAERDLVRHYLLSAPEYWEGRLEGPYQLQKIELALAAIEERHGLSRDAAVDQVLGLAGSRAAGHPPTVYVGGRGGSGSNWLAEMLHDLGPFANAGEVYLPRTLLRELRQLSRRQQAHVVDAIQLLHALRNRDDASAYSIVNPRGTVHYLRFKEWEPGCFYIHLIRDPREQCMSVTYRKPKARELRYPVDGGAEEFLRLNVNLYRTSLLRVLSHPVAPDYVVRYEDLRSGAEAVLVDLANAIGVSVPSTRAQGVAFSRSAEAILSGTGEATGNLYRGQRRTWRESTSVQERQVLHAGLTDILDVTHYDLDDCTGARLEPAPIQSDVVVELPQDVMLGELHARSPSSSAWERAAWATGSVHFAGGLEFRLRCPGGWTTALPSLSLLPAGALSALCLSANQDVSDDQLLTLSCQPQLRELDLSRTPISDAGLEHLDALRDLRALNLLGSRVTTEGAMTFADRHPQCVVAAGQLWSEQWRQKGWLEDEFLP
jgi:hypothetical protein